MLQASPIRATCPARLILLHFITRTILGEEYKSFRSSLCNLLHSSLYLDCMLRDDYPRSTSPHPPPPGDPIGGVIYLRIVLSPEQASRMCVFLNKDFYREGLLAPRPTPKLEDHPSSAVRDCLLNLFAATLLIECRSSIRNLRTHHAFVTGTHYAYIFYYYVRCCILSN